MGNFFACYVWWVLLGIALGFTLFWLYDKLFRRDGSNLLLEKDKEIQNLKQETLSMRSSLDEARAQAKLAESAGEKVDMAAKLGFSPFKNGEDNLTVIEGIGPKISSILKENGYKRFSDVASTEVDKLQAILDDKGPSFRLAKPGSWPKQAAMCVKGDWAELKDYQDRLVNGIEFDK